MRAARCPGAGPLQTQDKDENEWRGQRAPWSGYGSGKQHAMYESHPGPHPRPPITHSLCMLMLMLEPIIHAHRLSLGATEQRPPARCSARAARERDRSERMGARSSLATAGRGHGTQAWAMGHEVRGRPVAVQSTAAYAVQSTTLTVCLLSIACMHAL